ncbi:hypothetical protein ACIQAL_23490 [Pseudomonas sp. NPDC088368]|jgi:hypothetical protein|uniref:hypothetical protein n=1 Tax=Pseudomonas sp. NPDC088368 TaxID=3364453 RepID=UPI0038099FD9
MDAVLKWNFSMNKYVPHAVWVFVLTLLAGWAQAADPIVLDITVVNETREELELRRASWPFGNFTAEDYQIPKHHTGFFRINTWDEQKGRVIFGYTTGDKTCKFSGGIDQRRGAGWIIPTWETFSWSKTESVGNFHAYCTSSIKKKEQGKGYDLRFVIQ